jgi:hypothetical protein
VVDGTLDVFEGYQRVYGLYLDSSGSLEELKAFFRLPGIVPDGHLTVDDEFRTTIRRAAEGWLRVRGRHPIVLFSHEDINESSDIEHVRASRIEVASSLDDFLRKFSLRTLRDVPYEQIE